MISQRHQTTRSQNRDEKKPEKVRFTCWKCQHTWDDYLTDEHTFCPECKTSHGKITFTRNFQQPARR